MPILLENQCRTVGKIQISQMARQAIRPDERVMGLGRAWEYPNAFEELL